MAYAQQRGGYGQAPQNDQAGYYDNQPGDPYGYGAGNGYDDGNYAQAQSEPHHGRARYVDPGYNSQPQYADRGVVNPQKSYVTEDYGGGYGLQEQGYGQQQPQQSGYGRQEQGHGQQQPQQSGYGAGHESRNGGSGGNQQFQARPPPQRPGHSATPPQHSQGGPTHDRPPPMRQYDSHQRPATSGSSHQPRGMAQPGISNTQRPQEGPGYANGPQGRPRPGHRDRILPNSPDSPQTMAWDNPFGSFGKPTAANNEQQSKGSRDPRPATSDGHRQGQPSRQGSDPSRGHPRQQPSHDYPMPNGNQHAGPPAPYDDRGSGPLSQNQAPQRSYSGAGQAPVDPGRGAAPNFSRVQSPPVRNQYTPPQNHERSNTIPNEVGNPGLSGPARHGTPPTYQADLPFREGRAQTPVYASPQYAEAQSAVIETASEPPTAQTEWTDASHDSPHGYNKSMLTPNTQMNGGQASAHSSYGEFFDEYYDTRHSHDSHASNTDVPNFTNDRGNDELHLGPVNQGGLPPVRHAYGASGPDSQQHGFDFGTKDPYAQSGSDPYYNAPQQYGQYGQNGPPNTQRPPPQQYGRGGGRGTPRGRGMPPPRGRGYPGPLDRSMSAGPGPVPNGGPYGGPPPPNGRGMPPPRGRGGPMPGPYGDTRGPMSAPPNGPGMPPPRGRGATLRGGSGRGRGNPDALPHHPAPTRPGLAQPEGAAARPAPVRQYNNAPNPNQPPNQYRAPSISEGTPVTLAELQRLRVAVQDNPGDQATTLTLVKKLVEAASILVNEVNDPKARAKARERYIDEAYKLLKKLVGYNNQEAMFYMAECQGQGSLGLAKDPKEAFLLYQSAAKLGHAPSAYRVAVCCELGENEGGGTKRDPLKAMQWYKRAATLGDLPAMYKLGVILLKGLLGQNVQAGEAVNWLQRAADRADADNPHALHELGLLYENPPPQAQNSVIPDPNYSFELFTQAANLGYKFSQFRLGQAYEYGQLGLMIDARQSIAWYSKAAVQEEHQSELALSGWYLTGNEGVIQQSDTEAYLWARKAAQAGLAKAEYAMGYYTETGIGCSANLEDAKRWYWRAASQNFPKARERLEDLRKGGAKAQTRVSRTAMQKNEGDCKVM